MGYIREKARKCHVKKYTDLKLKKNVIKGNHEKYHVPQVLPAFF